MLGWQILRLIFKLTQMLNGMSFIRLYRQRVNPTPWITAEIYRNMRYRDSLVNLYRMTQNNLYLTLMRQQRNVVNSMIESANKRVYFKLA